jgi:hypothetical protein
VIEEEMIKANHEMFGDTIPGEVEAKICLNWGEK